MLTLKFVAMKKHFFDIHWIFLDNKDRYQSFGVVILFKDKALTQWKIFITK